MEAAAWIGNKAAASLHPAQVGTTLARVNAGWSPDWPDLKGTIENFPLGEESLLRLFALSSICASRIAQDPNVLRWISHPEICQSARDHIDMSNELNQIAAGDISTNNFRALRRWKNKEMTRIALRELSNAAVLE